MQNQKVIPRFIHQSGGKGVIKAEFPTELWRQERPLISESIVMIR